MCPVPSHNRIEEDYNMYRADSHVFCRYSPSLGSYLPATQQRQSLAWLGFALLLVAAMMSVPRSIAATSPGDTYVYRVINGYNHLTVGHVRHEVTPAAPSRGQVTAVTVDNAALGQSRTESVDEDGRWLRRPLDNHGIAVGYDFIPSLPTVQPSLAPGQSWSARVPAKVSGEDKNRSVRVDGRVLGPERIRVPAGDFDTVKIQRTLYAGDADYFISETRIFEVDWYAPSLGRSVRTETRSEWRDTRSGCRRAAGCDYRGDWHVFELAEVQAAIR